MKKLVAAIACLAIIGVASPAQATPVPGFNNLVIGTTFTPATYDANLATWSDSALGTDNGIEVSRVFFTGSQCPSWSDWRVQKLRAYNVIPFLSFKAYDFACMRNVIATMPTNIPRAYITWYHEGEANMDAATWKDHQNAMWNIVRGSGLHAAGRLLYMSVQTRQWTENNHRSYGDYWCGCGDYFAVDMYANTWENRYPDPGTFLSQSFAFAQARGLRIFYPELGAVRMAYDTTDQGRAAWINGLQVQMDSTTRFVGVMWWNAIGTPAADGSSRNFTLVGPSAAAWRHALAVN